MEPPETGSAFELGQLPIARGDDSVTDQAFLNTLEGLGDVAVPKGYCLSHSTVLGPQE